MKKETVCQCYHEYGVSAPDCEWLFTASHGNERYCPACKPLATKLRKHKYVLRQKEMIESASDITTEHFTACWLDRLCSNCGEPGVPIFNRYLCWDCWKNAPELMALTDKVLKVLEGRESKPVAASDRLYYEPPSEVIVYSSQNMSQEELQKLIPV